MIHTEFDFNELSVAYTGRVLDAAQRVRNVLAPLGLVGIIEGPNFLRDTTSVQVLLAGMEDVSILTGGEHGAVRTVALREAISQRLVASLAASAVFLNDECVSGVPRPGGDDEEPVQSWVVFAGAGLRAEHMVIAAAKDKSARWHYWEADGCGFVRYAGEQRYHRFRFPEESGVVVALIPEFQDIDVAVFARRQRHDFEFSDNIFPLVSLDEGTQAARQQALVWNDWFDLSQETFDQLAESTGVPRAAVELKRGLQKGTGISVLSNLLRNLNISRLALDYALSGDTPQSAQIFSPRGTLDKVRLIRTETARRTGCKPSFLTGLKMLTSVR